MKAFYLIDIKK